MLLVVCGHRRSVPVPLYCGFVLWLFIYARESYCGLVRLAVPCFETNALEADFSGPQK